MYTINKETFELLKENVPQNSNDGMFVQSKLTNCLVWKDRTAPDLVQDYCRAFGDSNDLSTIFQQALVLSTASPSASSSASSSVSSSASWICKPSSSSPSTSTSSTTSSVLTVDELTPALDKFKYSLFGSGSSAENMQQLMLVWEQLKNVDPSTDECKFCSIEPVLRTLYPKHQLYSTNGILTCPALLNYEANSKKQEVCNGSASM